MRGGGGGGISQAAADARYLQLAAEAQTVTGNLRVTGNVGAGAGKAFYFGDPESSADGGMQLWHPEGSDRVLRVGTKIGGLANGQVLATLANAGHVLGDGVLPIDLLNWPGITDLAASTTIGTGHQWCRYTPSATVTQTLPSAASFGRRALKISLEALYLLTLSRAGSDVIHYRGVDCTALRLALPGEFVVLVSDGADTWYVLEHNLPDVGEIRMVGVTLGPDTPAQAFGVDIPTGYDGVIWHAYRCRAALKNVAGAGISIAGVLNGSTWADNRQMVNASNTTLSGARDTSIFVTGCNAGEKTDLEFTVGYGRHVRWDAAQNSSTAIQFICGGLDITTPSDATPLAGTIGVAGSVAACFDEESQLEVAGYSAERGVAV